MDLDELESNSYATMRVKGGTLIFRMLPLDMDPMGPPNSHSTRTHDHKRKVL